MASKPLYYSSSPTGALFEEMVLKNSRKYFKSSKSRDKFNLKLSKKTFSDSFSNDSSKTRDNRRCCNSPFCWWQPAEDNLAIEFCQDTSMHGLKFVAQKKRHMSERIFWIIAFFFGVTASVYLINDVWSRYKANPVIVSFQPTEQDIDSIPFPAVTFCNINKFPKSRMMELEKAVKEVDTRNTKAMQKAKRELIWARSVCNSKLSFAKKFNYAANRGVPDHVSENDIIVESQQSEMLDFLIDNTIPCDELIHLCLFAGKNETCKEIFKPIITDYGKCCSFNILPVPLLLNDPKTEEDEGTSGANPDTVLSKNRRRRWSDDELRKWLNWSYSDGLVMKESLQRPRRQRRAGVPYGVDKFKHKIHPNLDEYYCPSSDSEGIRFILHTPLEMPHVTEFAGILELDKEIFVEINPEVTNADADIRSFDENARKCYFGSEKKLRFFYPYTGSNCIDECTALVITEKCNCSFFYMPHDKGVKICNTNEDSEDTKCIKIAKVNLLETLNAQCGHCDSLCEDIKYNYQTTVSHLQNSSLLWMYPAEDENMPIPNWANHHMSIVHIYYGSETTVPKLRKRLYGHVDLIASTGGLLGLFLGVSVLSAAEAIYFLTLRAFWKVCRRKQHLEDGIENNETDTNSNTKAKNRVINLNPHSLQVYPAYSVNHGPSPSYTNTSTGWT